MLRGRALETSTLQLAWGSKTSIYLAYINGVCQVSQRQGLNKTAFRLWQSKSLKTAFRFHSSTKALPLLLNHKSLHQLERIRTVLAKSNINAFSSFCFPFDDAPPNYHSASAKSSMQVSLYLSLL